MRAGGRLQTVMTVMKVVMIGGLALGALFFAATGSWSASPTTARAFPGCARVRRDGARRAVGVRRLEQPADGGRRGARSAAQPAARDHLRRDRRVRDLRARQLGYFRALPFAEVATSSSTVPRRPSVAQKTATQFLGGPAQALLAVAMTISALSAMNGSMLTGARVPYAVAQRRPRAEAARELVAPAPRAGDRV